MEDPEGHVGEERHADSTGHAILQRHTDHSLTTQPREFSDDLVPKDTAIGTFLTVVLRGSEESHSPEMCDLALSAAECYLKDDCLVPFSTGRPCEGERPWARLSCLYP